MNTEFKTTFIPKKKLAESRAGNTGEKQHARSSLLSLLAGLLFITAVVSVLGVYFYKIAKQKELATKIQVIKSSEKSFEPGLILELKKLDIRLRAAAELLDKHIALSDFFASLGESTLPSVSFKSFSYTYKDGIADVKMDGEAEDYLPIAQQSDLFEANRYIMNPIFSDFQKTEDGTVSFSLSFSLNPELIRYGYKIKNAGIKDIQLDKNIMIQNQEKQKVEKGKDINFH